MRLKRSYPFGVLLAMLAFLPSLQGQTTLDKVPTHGTINILIGSKYGLVAETDSMLSNGKQSPNPGQKLFKIDDKTICTIADFYSDPGPEVLGNSKSNPLATNIPGIFASYMHSLQSQKVVRFDTKVKWLTDDVIFNLQLLADVEELSGSIPNPHGSTLTVAGYDDGNLAVQRVRVKPIRTNQGIVFEGYQEPKVVLGPRLTYFTAGMDDVAQDMLSNSDSHHNYGSAEMTSLRKQLSLIDGASDELSRIEAAENKIVDETATFHSIEVGGARQVAVLAGGGLIKFQEPVLPLSQARRVVITLRGGKEIGDRYMPYAFEAIGYNVNTLVVDFDHYSDHSIQRLDNRIFAHSFFIDTVFIYQGYGLAVLDASNVLIDCTLILGPKVSDDDAFVVSLKRRYPDLRVQREQ